MLGKKVHPTFADMAVGKQNQKSTNTGPNTKKEDAGVGPTKPSFIYKVSAPNTPSRQLKRIENGK